MHSESSHSEKSGHRGSGHRSHHRSYHRSFNPSYSLGLPVGFGLPPPNIFSQPPNMFLPPNAGLPSNTQVNFYNPITGQVLAQISPSDDDFEITRDYNNNGINVTITGTKKDVDIAVSILNRAALTIKSPMKARLASIFASEPTPTLSRLAADTATGSSSLSAMSMTPV